MTPLILNTNFIKRESKIGYPQVSNWNPPDWEPTYSHNDYTLFNLQCDVWGVLNFYYISTFEVLEQSQRNSTSLKLCKCSQNPHPASRVASNSNKTNQHLVNHLQTLHIHYITPPRSLLCRSLGKEQQEQKVGLIYQVDRANICD